MHASHMATFGAALALCLAAGCADRAARYTPEAALARESLTAALGAWRDGKPAGSIPGRPAIQLVDTSRTPDRRLRAFSILSEQPTGAQGRAFVVRLSFENPPSDVRVRYVVVGIDPIWVFHKDDYDRLAHWEHPLEPVGPVEKGSDEEGNGPRSVPSEPASTSESAKTPRANHVRT